jgi:hypothetical protein
VSSESAFIPPTDPDKYAVCCRCRHPVVVDRLVDGHCPDCLPFRPKPQQTSLELPATMFDELAARRNRRRQAAARARRRGR